MAWSANGQTLAAASAGYQVRVWDLTGAAPRLLAKISLPNAYVNGVALAPDGKSVAATNADGKVRVWDLGGAAGTKERATLAGPAGWAYAIAFTADGKTLAAGFANGTVGVWDMTGKEPRWRFGLKGHVGPVRSLSFSADGKTLASSGTRTVRLWSLDDPPRAWQLSRTPAEYPALPWPPTAKRWLSPFPTRPAFSYLDLAPLLRARRLS